MALDVKTLQRAHEEDRKEFQDFRNKNFMLMQKNFDKIPTTLRRLLLEPDPGEEEVLGDRPRKCASLITTPVAISAGEPKQLPAPRATVDKPAHQTVGSATLKDHTSRELNLDGTPKVPYRYPNYGAQKQDATLQAPTQEHLQIQVEE